MASPIIAAASRARSEIKRITDLGVTILTNTPVNDLEACNSSTGPTCQRGRALCPSMRIEGEKLQGVYSAIDYLYRINSGERPNVGQKVVVGGGNTAIDAARCSAAWARMHHAYRRPAPDARLRL